MELHVIDQVWMGGCGPKQNLGGIKPIAPELRVVPELSGFIIEISVVLVEIGIV